MVGVVQRRVKILLEFVLLWETFSINSREVDCRDYGQQAMWFLRIFRLLSAISTSSSRSELPLFSLNYVEMVVDSISFHLISRAIFIHFKCSKV